MRERLTLLLLGVLPLHAFVVTVGTRIFAGPNQPPLGEIAFWKEALLGGIFVLATLEMITIRERREAAWYVDTLDLLVGLFFAVAIGISLWVHGDIRLTFYGIRYDLVPLLALLVFRRVPWSDRFRLLVQALLVFMGGLIAVLALVSLVLPQSVFQWLGYSDLHSLYVRSGPLAPFQQIGGMALRRAQATFSGPNQLGAWLLLPLAITARQFLLSRRADHSLPTKFLHLLSGVGRSNPWLNGLLTLLIGSALVLTFSRAAWIAGFFLLIIVLFQSYPREESQRTLVRLLGIGGFAVVLLLLLFPQVLLRIDSTRGHLEGPIQAVQRIVQQPLGYGLGTAGPASNRVSDSCVHLDAGADASWAQAHPNLCVFRGSLQVQPATRVCRCPFLPENWFLQIGVETGVIGLILYLVITAMVLWRLFKQVDDLSQVVGTAIAGVSVAALVLHAWEDAAVAYTLWILAGVCFAWKAPKPPKELESE